MSTAVLPCESEPSHPAAKAERSRLQRLFRRPCVKTGRHGTPLRVASVGGRDCLVPCIESDGLRKAHVGARLIDQSRGGLEAGALLKYSLDGYVYGSGMGCNGSTMIRWRSVSRRCNASTFA